MHPFRTILILLAMLLLISCDSGGSAADRKKPSRKAAPVLVEAVSVQKTPVSRTWERIGTLVHRHILRVYNQEEGRITSLPWYEGDSVKQGQVLLTLDDKLLKAELKKARATRSMAARKLARLERLRKTNATSEENLIAAQTELELAQAEVEILEIRLSYAVIRAPFDGIITQRLAEPGDIKPRNSHLLTLADPGSLLVRVEASAQLIADLTAGSQAQVFLDLPQLPPLRGKVRRIYPTLDPVTRQGKVEIRLEKLPEQIHAGQYARVELTGQEKQRLLIPFSALRRDRTGEYVYVIRSDRAQRREVRSGSRFGNRIEILEGLQGTESIIRRGFMNLKNDMAITVSEQT
jgi:membrane fusion protein (multidrug efflux system)